MHKIAADKGKNTELCVWLKQSFGASLGYKTSCNNAFGLSKDFNKEPYCPCCGKKIKIIQNPPVTLR